MIAQWMLYAVLLAFWFALFGLLVERVARTLGSGTRYVWFGALLCSVVLPPLAAWLANGDPHLVGVVAADGARVPTPAWLLLLDRAVLLGWLLASVVLLLTLVFSQGALFRARRDWSATELYGTSVLLSRDFGPGVVTFRRGQIVLPRWVLQLDEPLQLLLLEHEREHLRARDPWLLHAALLFLVLFPFNPILWWQFIRIKLAIEMDCDARVLAGRRNVREYAALLLDVGEKTRAGRFVFAAFAAPPHAIERRIRMMLHRKSRLRPLTVAWSAAGAMVVAVLACETPEPQSPEAAFRAAVGAQEEEAKPPRPEEGEETCCHASENGGKYFVEYDGQSPRVAGLVLKGGVLGVEIEGPTLFVQSGLGRYRTTVGGKHPYAEMKLRTIASEFSQLPPPPPPPPPPPRS
jgi:hypothetical protein